MGSIINTWGWDKDPFIDSNRYSSIVVPTYWDKELPDAYYVHNGPIDKDGLKIQAVSGDKLIILPGYYSLKKYIDAVFPDESISIVTDKTNMSYTLPVYPSRRMKPVLSTYQYIDGNIYPKRIWQYYPGAEFWDYITDFSVDNDGWEDSRATLIANQDNVEDENGTVRNNVLKITPNEENKNHAISKTLGQQPGDRYIIEVEYFIPSEIDAPIQIDNSTGGGTVNSGSISNATKGVWAKLIVDFTFQTTFRTRIGVKWDGTAHPEWYYFISSVKLKKIPSSGGIVIEDVIEGYYWDINSSGKLVTGTRLRNHVIETIERINDDTITLKKSGNDFPARAFRLGEFPVTNFSISGMTAGTDYLLDSFNGLLYLKTTHTDTTLDVVYDAVPVFTYIPKNTVNNLASLPTSNPNGLEDYFVTLNAKK